MNKTEILRGHTNLKPLTSSTIIRMVSACAANPLLAEFRKGHGTRLMSQTTNPKVAGEVWNKPKGSTYASGLAVLFLDAQGHLSWDHCGCNDVEKFSGFRASYALNAEELNILDTLEKFSRKLNPVSWARIEGAAAGRRGALSTENPHPTVPGNEGQPHYCGPNAAFNAWEEARGSTTKCPLPKRRLSLSRLRSARSITWVRWRLPRSS
jgi:hypothetical protein